MRIGNALLLIIFLFVLTTCSDDESSSWEKLTPYPGGARLFAPAVHNNNAYLFFGQWGSGSEARNFSSKVWKYTSKNDEWTELSAFEGEGRSRSTAFTIENSIYIVGGTIPTDDPDAFNGLTRTDEVLKYDITTDSWMQLSPFPGGLTSGGLSFKVGSEIFYGFGNNQNRNFWKYNPETDEWSPKTAFPGSLPFDREYEDYAILFSRVINFVYENKIFVITTADLPANPEMWQYDVLEDKWTEITDITFYDNYSRNAYRARGGTVSYVHENKCYFLLGMSLDNVFSIQLHSFDPHSHELRMSSRPLAPNFMGSGAFLIYKGSEIIVGTDYSSNYKKGFELWKFKL